MAVAWKVINVRRNEYWFDPADLVIKAELNGRAESPDLADLEASIREYGQLQPVVVRQENGKPVLIAGFSRWTAISTINQGRSVENRMKIRAVYSEVNEIDGFILNWEENRRRNPPVPMDDAHHFQQLTRWGLTEAQIAERCKVGVPIVKQRLALLAATPEIQDAVSNGRLTPSAAAKISRLSTAQQKEVAKGREKITVKVVAAVTGDAVRPSFKLVRDRIREGADDTTLSKATREYLSELIAFMDGTPLAVHA